MLYRLPALRRLDPVFFLVNLIMYDLSMEALHLIKMAQYFTPFNIFFHKGKT